MFTLADPSPQHAKRTADEIRTRVSQIGILSSFGLLDTTELFSFTMCSVFGGAQAGIYGNFLTTGWRAGGVRMPIHHRYLARTDTVRPEQFRQRYSVSMFKLPLVVNLGDEFAISETNICLH